MENSNVPLLPKHASIGQRFKEVREKTKLSQGRFAAKVGVKTSIISEIERGNRKPTDVLLIAIEYVYGVRRDWILTGDGDKWLAPRAITSYITPVDYTYPDQRVSKFGNSLAKEGEEPVWIKTEHPLKEDIEEIFEMLKNYGSPKLIKETKQRLLKIKEATEEGHRPNN